MVNLEPSSRKQGMKQEYTLDGMSVHCRASRAHARALARTHANTHTQTHTLKHLEEICLSQSNYWPVFWDPKEKPRRHRENMLRNSTLTVTWSHAWTRDPAAVRQQHYAMWHSAILSHVPSSPSLNSFQNTKKLIQIAIKIHLSSGVLYVFIYYIPIVPNIVNKAMLFGMTCQKT